MSTSGVVDHADGEPGEVLLRPLGDRVVVVGACPDGPPSGWTMLPAAAAAAARTALGLADGTPVAQRQFTMSAESLKHWDSDGKRMVGKFARGVLVDGDGHYSHQVQIREVHPGRVAGTVDLLNAATAVQIAAMQAQLNHMQSLIERSLTKIDAIADFLHIQQAGDINGAITLIARAHADAAQSGWVGEVEWSSVAGLEYPLRAALDAVEQELEEAARRITLTGDAKNDQHVVDEVDPERIVTLVKMHHAVEIALRRYTFLKVVRQQEVGEHDDATGRKHLKNLNRIGRTRRRLVRRIIDAVESAPPPQGRPWLERLFDDGVIIGGNHDRERIEAVNDFREKIRTQPVLDQAARRLPPPNRRLLLLPPTGTASA